MSNDYFLGTGAIDKERLTILGELYHPTALDFLIKQGLKPGMTVLEVGCGPGAMSCDLAKYVGPNGRVIALDLNQDQIDVAKQAAAQAGLSNIDFITADIMDLDSLNLSYDAVYGKWVLEFLPEPKEALALMYASLKHKGIMVYEATDMEQTRYFTIPNNDRVADWHRLMGSAFKIYNAQARYATSYAYSDFCSLGLKHINIKINQHILRNPRDKSVYRLALLSSGHSLIHGNLITRDALDQLIQDLEQFETSDSISGFFHNILMAGIKE